MTAPPVRTSPVQFSVRREGSPPDEPDATQVRAIDEGGGAFLELEREGQKIRFDLDELEAVTIAARRLVRAHDMHSVS